MKNQPNISVIKTGFRVRFRISTHNQPAMQKTFSNKKLNGKRNARNAAISFRDKYQRKLDMKKQPRPKKEKIKQINITVSQLYLLGKNYSPRRCKDQMSFISDTSGAYEGFQNRYAFGGYRVRFAFKISNTRYIIQKSFAISTYDDDPHEALKNAQAFRDKVIRKLDAGLA